MQWDTWRLKRACQAVNRGEVITYPTEAVWGLGCDPWNREAVEKILEIKRRPMEKGLILVASSPKQVERLLQTLSPEQKTRVMNSWPGPNTWLIPDPEELVPEWVRGTHSSVAIRVSGHPVASGLAEMLGYPIVSTSANPAAREPALTKLKVKTYFGEKIDFYYDGDLGESAKPSVIRDAVTGETVRA